ncbi:MAG: hypothetical protein KZQ73_05615 [Candidatus Thiodiazotropha sp. (ex Semelilucina semeliformis)]|nr:hypothetical protein [Candidatus Thiodiazotropha sp. (ex Semelilucina semeliformis)]
MSDTPAITDEEMNAVRACGMSPAAYVNTKYGHLMQRTQAPDRPLPKPRAARLLPLLRNYEIGGD